jgi:L-threonylcarbamoyladenylate synthase
MNIINLNNLDSCGRLIEAGGIVAVPTDRWYMLCCDASNHPACNRIYEAKRRDRSKPLALILPQRSDIGSHFHLSDDAKILIDAFWPGDLAFQLKWLTPELGRTYSSVGAEIALVTQPSGNMALLAEHTAVYIAATTANISGPIDPDGEGPAISVSEVLEFSRLSGLELAAIADGGICPYFQHMTIVDCSNPTSPAKIVREGTTHPRSIMLALRESRLEKNANHKRR